MTFLLVSQVWKSAYDEHETDDNYMLISGSILMSLVGRQHRIAMPVLAVNVTALAEFRA